MGTLRLKLHHANEGAVVCAIPQRFFRITKHSQFAQWQIDASSVAQILIDIPYDIGELKRSAQFPRILFALGIAVAKNLNTDESNRAGDPVTVSVQGFE